MSTTTVRHIVLMSILLVLPSALWGQEKALPGPDTAIVKICSNVAYFMAHFPQERVYLHFDNTSYYKGEHIYYKANVVRGDRFTPTKMSRILYVELVSPEGWPVERQKLIIKDGGAHGSFLLKDTLNSGFYEVRAYTSWMLNFTPGDERNGTLRRTRRALVANGERYPLTFRDNAGIFSRVFPIYEPVDSGRYGRQRIIQRPRVTVDLNDKVTDRLIMNFYPEGGNLVRGVPSRVAFEARNTLGEQVDVKGQLLREGEPIGSFGCFYGGRGVMSVMPDNSDTTEADDPAKSLSIKVNYKGKEYTFGLPKAQTSGYVLTVINRADTLATTVERNADTKGEILGLMLCCRGHGVATSILDMRNNRIANMAFCTDGLSTGVNIFTLFDTEGKVIAQREVFVNRHDLKKVRLEMKGPKEDLKPYQKVGLDFCLTDSMSARRRSETFSVAVTDDQFRDRTYAHGMNVMTDLLLSSEVKGFIPYPGYYFEQDDAAHRNALDMLLMVQGWTRYDFKQMNQGRDFKPTFKIEDGITLAGRVMHPQPLRSQWKTIKKEVWVKTEIDATDTIIDGEVQTSDHGKFHFDVPEFYGRGWASLVLNKKSSKVLGEKETGIAAHIHPETERFFHELNYKISPENVFPPLAKPYSFYETSFVEDTTSTNSVAYDSISKIYKLASIVKTGHRQWDKFDINSPSIVVDMKDAMSYVSEINGYIQNSDWAHNREAFGEICAYFGLTGYIRTYINNFVEKYISLIYDHYSTAVGDQKLLAKDMEFLPPADNIQRVAIFADFHNRDLIYCPTPVDETFYLGLQDRPTSIRMNFITDKNYLPGAVHREFYGYRILVYGISQPDAFYAPDYSHTPLPTKCDYRRTVYWNPDVQTDAKGQAHVEFYNNGFSTGLHISAEGITKDGIPMVGE
jgi:hypothetical protein